MKVVKLDHELAQAILAGTKRSTWRLFDDKDLSEGDKVELLDKVDPEDRSTWTSIGEAKIQKVIQKSLGDIDFTDPDGHESYNSLEEMIGVFRGYYVNEVDEATEVKIIHFVLNNE